MGFVRKLTGAQAQVDAYKKNTEAQVAAQTKAAQEAAAQAIDNARATADSVSAAAAREQAANTVAEIQSQPIESAEVQVEGSTTSNTAESIRKRRGTFGKNYLAGTTI